MSRKSEIRNAMKDGMSAVTSSKVAHEMARMEKDGLGEQDFGDVSDDTEKELDSEPTGGEFSEPKLAHGGMTSEKRNSLPKTSFALPGERKYPINDISHARNALSRASANAAPSQQAEIRAKVHKKFPSIGKK